MSSFDDMIPYDFKGAVRLIVNTNMRDPGLAIHLRGKPGGGKTSVCRTAALLISKTSPTLFVTNIMPGHTDETFGGYLTPQKAEDGEWLTRFSRPTTLPHKDELQHLGTNATYQVFVGGAPVDTFDGLPERAIIVLDDHAHAGIDVKKLAANLKLEGVLNGYRVPPKTTIVSTGNRAEDKSGTTKELAFETNRQFTCLFEPDVRQWASYARKAGVPDELVAYALWTNGQCFADDVPPDPGMPFCTPRSMVLASRMLRITDDAWGEPSGAGSGSGSGDRRLLANDDTRRILQGYLGPGTAQDIYAYLSVLSELPTIKEIVTQPDMAYVPPAHDAQKCFRLSQMIIGYYQSTPKTTLRAKNMALSTYINRLPGEVRDTTFRVLIGLHDGLIGTTDAFREWNGDGGLELTQAS